MARAAKCHIGLGNISDAERAIAAAQAVDPTVNVKAELESIAHLDKCSRDAATATKAGQYNIAISMLVWPFLHHACLVSRCHCQQFRTIAGYSIDLMLISQ